MDFGKFGNCLEGRVHAIRKDQGLNQDKFGRAIGVTRSAICNYENGTRPVSEQSILAICREFNVNELWMRHGVGEPYKTKGEDAIANLILDFKCSNFEGEFLKSYFQMDKTEREQFVQAMYRFIAPFAKNLNGKNPFAEYYDLTTGDELFYAKAQSDKASEHIKALQRIDKLEQENQKLQARLESIKKEKIEPREPITETQSVPKTPDTSDDIEALAQKAAEITREQAAVEKKPDASVSSVKESDAG